MARWIGVFCGLVLVNVANAQEYAPPSPYTTPPQYFDPSQYANPAYAPRNPQGVPIDGFSREFVPAGSYHPIAPAAGVTISPYAPAGAELPQPLPPSAPMANLPQPIAQPPQPQPTVVYQPPPPVAVNEREPLEIVVYEVADLVVGANGPTDPNQAMLAMLAQQSEEFALMLNAANANGGESQSRIALGELAETIESTFEDDFGQGRGSITLHAGTMSLIVRQTPAMHEQISDLLTQLRRINDTSINITLRLCELDDAHTAFAMSHNGQVLDEAALQQFHEMTAEEEIDSISVSVSTRNGQNTNLLGYGFPASLTAIATEDRRSIRVNLSMMFGMDEGMPSMQHNHRVPTGKSVLMTLLISESAYMVLMSAEIEKVEEEVALQSNTVAEQVELPSACPNSELANDEPSILFQTEAILATVEGGTPDEVLKEILELVGASSSLSERAAIYVSATKRDQILQALQEDGHCSVISRPQVYSRSDAPAHIQVGREARVVSGVSFVDGEPVPTYEDVECGLSIELVQSITSDGLLCLKVSMEQSEFQEEEVVLTGGITSPVRDELSAESTFKIPPGQSLVWPVPKLGDDDSTLLIILTSQVEDCSN